MMNKVDQSQSCVGGPDVERDANQVWPSGERCDFKEYFLERLHVLTCLKPLIIVVDELGDRIDKLESSLNEII